MQADVYVYQTFLSMKRFMLIPDQMSQAALSLRKEKATGKPWTALAFDSDLRVTAVLKKICVHKGLATSEKRYTPTKLEWLALNMQAWAPMALIPMRRLFLA
jgi:hypothetical protein